MESSKTSSKVATCDAQINKPVFEGNYRAGQASIQNLVSDSRAQLSVESDDEHPDPEALAQFLGANRDFQTPFSIQREKLWQEKTRFIFPSCNSIHFCLAKLTLSYRFRSVKRVNEILRKNGDLLQANDSPVYTERWSFVPLLQ
jgi:hypothetical protein